ncbi:unnamed protein product [Rhizophagus irregularis]|nr:unnamed protein product [Rhizophagus irregularis]CAB4405757.1 unnamed protein product [Rhizophagus irregularis]
MDEVTTLLRERIGLAIRKRSSGLFNVVEVFEGVSENANLIQKRIYLGERWSEERDNKLASIICDANTTEKLMIMSHFTASVTIRKTFFLGLIRYLDTQKHSLASICLNCFY